MGELGGRRSSNSFFWRYFDIVVEEDGVIGRSVFVDVVEEDGVTRRVGWRWQSSDLLVCFCC